MQPARAAAERVASKVELDGEHAVVDGSIIHRHGRIDLRARSGSIIQLELKVVEAVGRVATVSQVTLIGKPCTGQGRGISRSSRFPFRSSHARLRGNVRRGCH